MKAAIYCKNIFAGVLEQHKNGFSFTYCPDYVANSMCPAISLTLPKRLEAYHSKVLFPFFYGLLAEGINKKVQCRELKIDEEDHLTRMLYTLNKDSVGAVTIKPLEI